MSTNFIRVVEVTHNKVKMGKKNEQTYFVFKAARKLEWKNKNGLSS